MPFECNSVGYQFSGYPVTQVSTINIVTGKVTFKANLPNLINAVGFNPTNNLIYGLRSNQPYTMDDTYTLTALPPITGLPIPSGPNYTNGAFDPKGYFYIMDSSQTKFYVIDYRLGSTTYGKLVDSTTGYTLQTGPIYGIPLIPPIPPIPPVASDWAWNTDDGNLYGADISGNIIRVNPLDGHLTILVTSGLIPQNYGAAFSYDKGQCFVIGNSNGVVYKITIDSTTIVPTATANYFSQANPSNDNDGASCINAQILVDYGDAPDAGPNTGNGPNNYSTLLANNGPRHAIINDLKLGIQVTGENDAYQNTTATGDDIPKNIQDDGVIILKSCIDKTQTSYDLDVSYTNNTGSNAYIYAWIDFNRDGIFQKQEIANVVPVTSSTTNPRTTTLSFVFPPNVDFSTGHTFIRLRITSDELINSNSSETAEDTRSLGPASDGEVEDYILYISDTTVVGISWFDLNFDGLYDNTESLISNVLFELYNTSDTTTPIAFTTTNSSGAYTFNDVSCGDYFIRVTAPSGYKFTIPFVGTNPLINSDINPNSSTSLNFSISQSNPNQIINAGFVLENIKISGVTFYDCNNDSIFDDDDTVLSGVNVILLDANKNQLSSTITNSNGYYEFINLNSGTYYVRFISPPSMNIVSQNLSYYGSKPSAIDSTTNYIYLENKDALNIYAGFKGSITQDFKYCQSLNNCGCSCNCNC
ncbi:MAG: SdrD B-like domain-containing protein [Peptostreptococcaceae bacterium]